MVLGAAHGLAAFAGTGAALGDDLRHPRRADEGDAGNVGAFDEGLDDLAGAVDQIEHPPGEAAVVDQFGDPLQGAGHLLGRLHDVGVAGGQGIRKEPERHHAREIEGRDHGEDADRQTQHLAVDPGRRVQQFVALLQDRHAAGGLDVFDGALHFRPRIGDGFPPLLGDQARNLLAVPDQKLAQAEQRRRAVIGRGHRPIRESGFGRRDRRFGFGFSAERHLGDGFGGARVFDVEPFDGRRIDPLAVDVVAQFSDGTFGHDTSPSLISFRETGPVRRGWRHATIGLNRRKAEALCGVIPSPPVVQGIDVFEGRLPKNSQSVCCFHYDGKR